MRVRIYQDIKSPIQSGKNNKNKWCLEFVDNNRFIEQELGRVASMNMMRSEVALTFLDQDSAICFAQSNNYEFEIIPSLKKKFVKKSYANNFK